VLGIARIASRSVLKIAEVMTIGVESAGFATARYSPADVGPRSLEELIDASLMTAAPPSDGAPAKS
jgi:hypothetical protein